MAYNINPKDEDKKYKANHLFNKSLLFKERTRNPIISVITAVIIVAIIFKIFKKSKLCLPSNLIFFLW